MVCVPWVSDEVEKLALPLTKFTFADLAPSLKVTVPVGDPVPERLALTCAVKVTFWPTLDGSGALLAWRKVPPVFRSTDI